MSLNSLFPAEASTPDPALSGLVGERGALRPHLFDGRLLDARLFRTEAAWRESRLTAVGALEASGVLYGLEVEAPGLADALVSGGAGGVTAASAALVLRAGLARDGVGRPIAVSADGVWMLETLLDAWLVERLELLPPVSAGLRTRKAKKGDVAGLFLVVASASEAFEGKTPVIGACDASEQNCGRDGLRGGVSLALLRVIPLPSGTGDRVGLASWMTGAWEAVQWVGAPVLGTSAWLGAHVAGNGSVQRGPTGTHIPLALLVVGPSRNLLHVDTMTPRRRVRGTAAAEGAGRRPASDLGDGSRAALTATLAASEGKGLLERGVRRLPSWGVLPTPTDPSAAREAVRALFHGTSILVAWEEVLHEDAVLERIAAAETGRTVLVRARPAPRMSGTTLATPEVANEIVATRELCEGTGEANAVPAPLGFEPPIQAGRLALEPWLRELGELRVSFEQLVRGDLDLVRVMRIREVPELSPELAEALGLETTATAVPFVIYARHPITWEQPLSVPTV